MDGLGQFTLYSLLAVNIKLAMNCNCASPVVLFITPCRHALPLLAADRKPYDAATAVASGIAGNVIVTSNLTGSILILKGGTKGAPKNVAVLLYTSGMYRVCASKVTCMRPSPRS